MPMGITNEVLVHREEDREARSRFAKLRYWLAVGEALWSRRMTILCWALVGTGLSGLLAWRICVFEATAQIMPPDSGAGGLSSLALSGLLKGPGTSGLAGLAGDMFGIKSSGALFL